MKGVASTIVLVAIAIIVIGAIGLNYYKPGETPPILKTTVTERDYQSKLLTYCTQWSSARYGRDAVSTGNRSGPWDAFAAGCNGLNINPTTEICDRVIKSSGVTGRAAAVSKLGFGESCNPRENRCDIGLACTLGRDNIYRCLRQ